MATTTNTSISNLASIKAAIVYAHDDMHNKHALNEKDFEKLGLSNEAWNNWCDYVEELRQAVVAYNKLTQGKDEPTKKDEDTAEGRIMAEWRRVLKQGTEKDFNKNFFIRRGDATTIAKFAGLNNQDTGRGQQFVTRNKTDFRRKIEILIGIRMAGNGMLDDDQRDLIVAYEKAERTIKSNNVLLDGDGKDKKGLRDTYKGLNAKLVKQEEMMGQLGISKEQADELLKELRKAVDETNTAIKTADKNITEAQKTIDKTKKDYDKAIALLKSVSDYQ